MYIIAFVTLVPRLFLTSSLSAISPNGLISEPIETGNILLLSYSNNQIIILNAKVLNRITWQEIILFTVDGKSG